MAKQMKHKILRRFSENCELLEKFDNLCKSSSSAESIKYEQLTAENRALRTTVEELCHELLARQDNASEALSAPAAIGGAWVEKGTMEVKRTKLVDAVERYEVTVAELQSSAEELRRQLRESLQAGEKQTAQIAQLQRLLNDKEMSLEQYIAQAMRQRRY